VLEYLASMLGGLFASTGALPAAAAAGTFFRRKLFLLGARWTAKGRRRLRTAFAATRALSTHAARKKCSLVLLA
jgi:hypothetical protein